MSLHGRGHGRSWEGARALLAKDGPQEAGSPTGLKHMTCVEAHLWAAMENEAQVPGLQMLDWRHSLSVLV